MSIERLRPSFAFDSDRLEQLKAIAPEAFEDGKINWEILREVLGEHLEDERNDTEHFGLTWPGKRAARRRASEPSRGTLVPVPGDGIKEDSTRNVFIEADNLEALKLLQKAYAGRVKMIYIDPPYNTGNDFVYRDDFRERSEDYLRRTGQMNEQGQYLTTNTKADGRFHSNWLNMMYPRLRLARQLLREDGLIFVSIDDNEIHNLRSIMDEVFGSECFIGTLIWKRRQQVDSRAKNGLSVDHEYIVIYCAPDGRIRGKDKDLTKYSNPDNDPRGPWASDNLLGLATREQRPNLHYDLVNPETNITYPCADTGWRYSPQTMSKLISEGRILWPDNPTGRPRLKRFLNELQDEFTGLSSILNTVFNLQGTREVKDLFDGREVFDFPKPVELLKLLIQQGTITSDGESCLVLDFFAGSGTTAQAVWELNRADQGNRQFILVQLNEPTDREDFQNISQISVERLKRVVKKLEQDAEGQLAINDEQDLGFRVFRYAASCFKPWQDYEGDSLAALEQQFTGFETPLVDEWRDSDLLTEVMLLRGFPLDSRMETLLDTTANTIYLISSDFQSNSLYICLDPKIADETITRLALGLEDVFVCQDSALTDQAKIRLADVCNLRVI